MANTEQKNALDRYLGVVYQAVSKRWGAVLAGHLVAPNPGAILSVTGCGNNSFDYTETHFDWLRKTSVL
ncbi:MAG: hypothetical protein AAB697_01850, partial [Patescibacteria group bacterium]